MNSGKISPSMLTQRTLPGVEPLPSGTIAMDRITVMMIQSRGAIAKLTTTLADKDLVEHLEGIQVDRINRNLADLVLMIQRAKLP